MCPMIFLKIKYLKLKFVFKSNKNMNNNNVHLQYHAMSSDYLFILSSGDVETRH